MPANLMSAAAVTANLSLAGSIHRVVTAAQAVKERLLSLKS